MARIPLSHSRLELAGCLRLFRAATLPKTDPEHVDIPKTVPMMFGGLFHNIAARYLGALTVERDPAVTRETIMEKCLEAEWADHGSGEYAALGDDYYDDLRDLCRWFATRTNLSPGFVGAEMRYAVDEKWNLLQDWLDPKVFYRGIVDRLDVNGGVVEVEDFKTGFRAASQDEVERSPQLRGYGAIVKAALKDAAQRIRVRFNFVRTGIVREVMLEADAIEEAKARIMKESDRIEAAKKRGKWDPTPGALCEYCPIFDNCPARTQAAPHRPPESPAEAGDLLAAIQMRKREVDELETRLQAFVNQHGAVRTGGLVAEYATRERRAFPIGALREILDEHNLELQDFVNADLKGLDRVSRKNKKLAEGLETIVRVSPYTQWSVHRDREED